MTGVPGKRATTKTETSRYDEAELALGFTGTTASAEGRPQRAVKILAKEVQIISISTLYCLQVKDAFVKSLSRESTFARRRWVGFLSDAATVVTVFAAGLLLLTEVPQEKIK